MKKYEVAKLQLFLEKTFIKKNYYSYRREFKINKGKIVEA